MKYNGLDVYIVDEHSDIEVEFISLVDKPANKREFIAMSEDEREQIRYQIFDEEQRIVFGLVLSPNTPYLRRDSERGAFYAVFTEAAIKQANMQFMHNARGTTNILSHNPANETDKIYLIESFIKNEKAGISPKGFEDEPDGSWFVSYRIEDDDIWEQIKAHTFNGFSIHGSTRYKNSNMEREDEMIAIAEQILKTLSN